MAGSRHPHSTLGEEGSAIRLKRELKAEVLMTPDEAESWTTSGC